MALNVNLNGIDTLLLDFDGTTTAVLTAPGTTTISHTGAASGISQLTGDVTAGPGSGSQVATLSNTSTARANLGLGTMATQNANAVAVTGGAINGTAIGATTPSTIVATQVHSATIGLDNETGFPANNANIQGNSGTLYIDSIGPNSSTFGAFSLRGVHASTGVVSTYLSSDTAGNWTAAKSLTLASGSGGSITFQDGTTQSTAAVSPTLQTNGTNNTVQNKLNLVAGANVTLTADGTGDVTLDATGVYSLGGSLSSSNIALGTAPGPGSSISVVGLDGNHQVTLNVGPSPTSGTTWTVTFTANRGHVTYPAIFNVNGNFVASGVTGTATGYQVSQTGGLIANSTYVFNILCP